MHHSALPLDLNNHIANRAFDCGVLRLAHEFRRSNGCLFGPVADELHDAWWNKQKGRPKPPE
jgi:hypothetical protein